MSYIRTTDSTFAHPEPGSIPIHWSTTFHGRVTGTCHFCGEPIEAIAITADWRHLASGHGACETNQGHRRRSPEAIYDDTLRAGDSYEQAMDAIELVHGRWAAEELDERIERNPRLAAPR
jgi:hypothetical protein